VDHLVAVLGECQRALSEHGSPRPSHPGYLAAYPETQFILLERYTTYPTIWVPYYTCHKIMRGLLDAHTLTGNAQALAIASAMGDWVHSRLGHLPKAQLERMWSIYIAGEYGGMNEVLADLYALTGRQEHLAAARCFDNTTLLDACAEDRDLLDGLHANQHVPQFTGYLRLFDHSDEERYAAAARNFWGMVAGPRTYSLGGTGQGEMFRARGAVAGTLGDNIAETCATYNMLKLSRQLFFHKQDPAYMDYYERAMTSWPHGGTRPARTARRSPTSSAWVPASFASTTTSVPAAAAPAWRTTPSTRTRSISAPPTAPPCTSTSPSPRHCGGRSVASSSSRRATTRPRASAP
jgi:hypothetical protein